MLMEVERNPFMSMSFLLSNTILLTEIFLAENIFIYIKKESSAMISLERKSNFAFAFHSEKRRERFQHTHPVSFRFYWIRTATKEKYICILL